MTQRATQSLESMPWTHVLGGYFWTVVVLVNFASNVGGNALCSFTAHGKALCSFTVRGNALCSFTVRAIPRSCIFNLTTLLFLCINFIPLNNVFLMNLINYIDKL